MIILCKKERKMSALVIPFTKDYSNIHDDTLWSEASFMDQCFCFGESTVVIKIFRSDYLTSPN
jgi:hypothetical protein